MILPRFSSEVMWSWVSVCMISTPALHREALWRFQGQVHEVTSLFASTNRHINRKSRAILLGPMCVGGTIYIYMNFLPFGLGGVSFCDLRANWTLWVYLIVLLLLSLSLPRSSCMLCTLYSVPCPFSVSPWFTFSSETKCSVISKVMFWKKG